MDLRGPALPQQAGWVAERRPWCPMRDDLATMAPRSCGVGTKRERGSSGGGGRGRLCQYFSFVT